jgi:hypothetical protein
MVTCQSVHEFHHGSRMGTHANTGIFRRPETCRGPPTETCGALDGNGHISTLLTGGPNPALLVKSIHPHVGILHAKITTEPPADPLVAWVLSVREKELVSLCLHCRAVQQGVWEDAGKREKTGRVGKPVAWCQMEHNPTDLSLGLCTWAHSWWSNPILFVNPPPSSETLWMA